jgi:hypothetical protein
MGGCRTMGTTLATREDFISRQDAERLVNIDLANVESVVMAAL